ncbi:MAG TPA: hypothetical protein VE155_14520 [Pseudonocardiaceae bacterium]|nr:hypothetical protein [Pseudonocardiaceae bacterium]
MTAPHVDEIVACTPGYNTHGGNFRQSARQMTPGEPASRMEGSVIVNDLSARRRRFIADQVVCDEAACPARVNSCTKC